MKRRQSLIFLTALAFLLVLIEGILINIYTDWLFFEELNYKPIFVKILSTKLMLGIILLFLSLIFFTTNIIIANKTNFLPIDILFDGQTRISLNIEMIGRWIKQLSVVGGIIASIFKVFEQVLYGVRYWFFEIVLIQVFSIQSLKRI